MKLSYQEYVRKVAGCFLGKTVGGTLGMPYEGDLSERTVTYYDPVPTEMVANDDLDLQVINLEHILQYGLPVSGRYLGKQWSDNLLGWPDEYGVANHNTLAKIYAPLSGSFNNYFHGGMGAAIRSELWACLCPGDPALAAKLSRQDSCSDHTDDGMDAEMFLAAVESLAFVEDDYRVLIERGLSFIPQDGRLAKALRDTWKWWEELHDIHEVRVKLLENYYSDNWTDVSINLSLILLAWLAGEDNFSRGICIAAGLGYDADCTCATLGAILGMRHPEQIEERWTAPIGDALVLSSCVVGMHEPETINEFCDRLIGICPQILSYYGSEVEIADFPADKTVALPLPWAADPEMAEWPNDKRTAVVALQPMLVHLRYPENVSITPGIPAEFTAILRNPASLPFRGSLEIRVPDGWKCSPVLFPVDLEAGATAECTFTITADPADKRRPNFNPVLLCLEHGGFRWTCTAGIPLTIPWMRKRLPDGEWECVEAANNFQILPKGEYVYRTEVKMPHNEDCAWFNVQSYRPTSATFDGVVIAEHDGSEYLPAFHRSKAVRPFSFKGGWHTLEITVADGDEAELFVGFSDRSACGQWVNGCEYRHLRWG